MRMVKVLIKLIDFYYEKNISGILSDTNNRLINFLIFQFLQFHFSGEKFSKSIELVVNYGKLSKFIIF